MYVCMYLDVCDGALCSSSSSMNMYACMYVVVCMCACVHVCAYVCMYVHVSI